MEIRNLKEEIHKKNNQIASLGKHIADSTIRHGENDKLVDSQVSYDISVLFKWLQLYSFFYINCYFTLQSVAELMEQLNEKSFELEVANLVHLDPKISWYYNH